MDARNGGPMYVGASHRQDTSMVIREEESDTRIMEKKVVINIVEKSVDTKKKVPNKA